jgi:hypothetical protein
MLVVRVKRNREDEPAGTLCLVESNNEVTSLKKRKKLSLTDMSLNRKQNDEINIDNNLRKQNNFLFLRHISTINQPVNQELDSQTMGLVSKNHQQLETAKDDESAEIGEENRHRKRQKLIVSQGKVRSLPRVGEESCIIVDMMQIYKTSSNSNESINDKSHDSSSVVTTKSLPSSPSKVLDPATRILHRGMITAFKKNDFNDLSTALIQGANPNYQISLDSSEEGGLIRGFTPLMIAVSKGNLRMVKRLLLTSVNTLTTNKDGLTAVDLIPVSSSSCSSSNFSRRNHKDFDEIRLLLQQTMVKQLNQNQRQRNPREMRAARSTGSENRSIDELPDDSYVIDLYCVDTSAVPVLFPTELDQGASTVSSSIHTSSLTFSPSLISVDGLRILDDGGIEIFHYDSDWSDLADDEDPDSNDERYFANDYPEEDSDDDGGGRLFREEDGEQGDDFSSEDEDRRIRFSSDNYRRRKIDPSLLQNNSVHRENLKIENQLNDLIRSELGGKGTGTGDLFHRQQSVGKVLRPRLIEDDLFQRKAFKNKPFTYRNSESLRELYEEEEENDDEENNEYSEENEEKNIVIGKNSERNERLKMMRNRTGMLFASNPKEFNKYTGLPKSGVNLSDNEEYDRMVDDDELDHLKPSHDTVAYDSDLDDDSSHDIIEHERM